MRDWQSGQTFMVNTYKKHFPRGENIPWGGSVYPADLVTRTADLARDLEAAKREMAEKDARLKAYEEQQQLAAANALDEEEESDEPEQTEVAESLEKAMQDLREREARIAVLEEQNAQYQSMQGSATSSRDTIRQEETQQRLAETQQQLEAAQREVEKWRGESQRMRTTWGGGRTSLSTLKATGGGSATPAITPEIAEMMKMMKAMTDVLQKFVPQGAALAPPSVINVLPAQTDAKKVALTRVNAIVQLFDPAKKALAWKVTETDHSGNPQSYDMEGATERVRSIVTQRFGRFGSHPPKTFLTNVSLLLFDYGGDGLTLEDFNTEKTEKIKGDWDRFTMAYMHMRYVLGEYVSDALGKAID